MRRLLTATVVALAAMSCPNSVGLCAEGGGGFFNFADAGFTPTTQQIFLTGSLATLTLTAPTASTCDVPPTMATAAETSVVGPDNLPVMSTQANLSSPMDSSGLYTVNVTFTPIQPGPYHVVAKFQPNLGIAQLDILVAADRSALPVQTLYAASAVDACLQFTVTTVGTLLCRSSAGVIVAFRGGAAVDSVTGTLMAAQGNTVWVFDSLALTINRFTDTGTGPLKSELPNPYVVASAASQLLPGADDVLLMMDNQVERVGTLADGGFGLLSSWVIASVTVAARNGNDVLFASGGVAWQSLDGGSLQVVRSLTTSAADPIAFGPEGIWFLDSFGQTVSLYNAGSTSPLTAVSSLGGWGNVQVQYGIEPVATGNGAFVATWNAASQQVVLSQWGSQFPLPLVSSEWAILQAQDGTVVVKQVPQP